MLWGFHQIQIWVIKFEKSLFSSLYPKTINEFRFKKNIDFPFLNVESTIKFLESMAKFQNISVFISVAKSKIYYIKKQSILLLAIEIKHFYISNIKIYIYFYSYKNNQLYSVKLNDSTFVIKKAILLLKIYIY